MTRLTTGFHPDFDALSAHVDRSDTEAARTRVGRHVAECDACRVVVEEIRGLGVAARQGEVPGAPAALWARIERKLEAGVAVTVKSAPEREIGVVTTSEDAPRPDAPASTRVTPAMRRMAFGLVALCAVVSTVLLIDSRDPLAAATPRRLTMDRQAARPGATITVHYRPITSLATQPSLTLWLIGARPEAIGYDRPLRRAGTLHRVSALDYTGTTLMPDSMPLASYVVGDSTGDVLDRTEIRGGFMPAAVLAANVRGEPRLDALVAVLSTSRGSPDRATMTRWATRMRELYPNAPETWILGDVHARRGVIGDIVKLFESRERQYYSWHDRLEHRADLSEQTEVMMSSLGSELMDTARADFWSDRLLRDHPESEWAPSIWIARYRDVPDDSAAAVLRTFEPIWIRSRSPRRVLERAIALAQRSGDSTLIKRWELRIDPREMSWLLESQLAPLVDDPGARREVERRLTIALAETDSSAQVGPTLSGFSRRFAIYQHALVRTRLAALQLVAGDARGAKSALDSLVRAWDAQPTCPIAETMRWRAEAARRLGQMKDAEADLAYVATIENWRLQVVGDSASTLLGDYYTKSSWDGALVAAKAYHRKCWEDSRAAQSRRVE